MTQAEVLAWNNAIDVCRAAMLIPGTFIDEGTMQAEPVTAANITGANHEQI